MDKASVLCDKDKAMLREFSRRVVGRVTGRSFPALRLPFLGAFIDANVLKEVEKDRIIILHAAQAFAAGRGAGDVDGDALFEETKAVDREFVRKLAIPSVSVSVRYQDFSDIRKTRIRQLAREVHTMLRAWQDAAAFEEMLRAAYSEAQFKGALTEILHLYNLETRMLSRSIRSFPPFHMAVTMLADALFDTMETVSRDLSDDYAKLIYRGAPVHA